MSEGYILSLILALPFLGALLVSLLNKESRNAIRILGLAFSAGAFVLSVWLFIMFDGGKPDMQFVEKYAWIPELDV